MEEDPDSGDTQFEEVINAFDSVYGDGSSTVKGVFQGLATVVSQMAESVGFKASMTFSKTEQNEPEPEPEPDKESEQTDEKTQDKEDDKKKDDEEELTDEEKELCEELESLIEELSKPDITPERYNEILERKGVIEFKLKGGDK